MSTAIFLANDAAGLKPYVQRVRAYGELYSGKISAGSRRSGPLRFVAYMASCGLVDAEKVLAESSGPFSSLQVPGQLDSQIAHIERLCSMMRKSI
jgi:hypothetical protein